MITKSIVEDTLFKMGLPSDMDGFDFIVELLVLMDKNRNCWNWKDMYNTVALMYGTHDYTVSRRIKYSIDWLKNHPQDEECYGYIEKYVGFKDDSLTVILSRMYRIINREAENVYNNEHYDDQHLRDVVKSILKEMIISA